MPRRNRLAIIGRPNVGKSTLFNVITESRRAVVKDQPGVTRDIQIQPADWCGVDFDVVDTGGITEAQDTFSPLIREQVLEIIKSVDALVVVVDARAGVCPEDFDLLRIAHESEKPFLVVANKVDRPDRQEDIINEFFQLGVEVLPCAFEKRWGVDIILDWALDHFPDPSEERTMSHATLAIIGKPNAGKSSLVNRILGENRMLVSEVAGTTVDAIDSEFERNGRSYTIIDTAGVRRKSRQKEDVEILASFKSIGSIRRADIVLLVIDGVIGPTDQDAKLVEEILNAGRAVIVVANKVDLAGDVKPEFRKSFRTQAGEVFHFFEDVPVVFVSAKTGSGMQDLFEKIDFVWDKLNLRIKTSELNDFFFEVIRLAPAPVFGTRDVKFYYLVQTHQRPPSFIAFANAPDGVDNSYRRFLAKRIKERWGLIGIPVRIYAMKRGGRRLTKTVVAEGYQREADSDRHDGVQI